MPFGNRANDGLGKSIAEVLQKTPKSKDANRGFLAVDINTIIPPEENPRQIFRQEDLQELADSIRIHGILQPLVVLKKPAGYEILSGERRFRAARIAGLDKVPVVIREYESEQECAELRLIENIQRQDLNPVELARAYQELISKHTLTQEDLAVRLGKNRSSIANCLRLLTLEDSLLTAIATGDLSMGHAKVLLSIDDLEIRRSLAQRCIDEGLSVRMLEVQARTQVSTPSDDKTTNLEQQWQPAKGKPPHLRELEENLQRLLSAKVKVVEKAGKGSLTVYFSSSAEFQDLIANLDLLLRKPR